MRPEAKIAFARELRKRMTDAEQLLWRHLRRRQLAGCRFRRQHPVGPYIVDFACIECGLAIEVDGGQHHDSATDRRREDALHGRGFEVLRFWNNEVLEHIEGVCDVILRKLAEKRPHPGLPPHAGEGAKRERCHSGLSPHAAEGAKRKRRLSCHSPQAVERAEQAPLPPPPRSGGGLGRGPALAHGRQERPHPDLPPHAGEGAKPERAE